MSEPTEVLIGINGIELTMPIKSAAAVKISTAGRVFECSIREVFAKATCPVCKGVGKLQISSKNYGPEVVTCNACGGQGTVIV